MVWGAKTLHFMAPETFPQPEASVEAALGLRRSGYHAHDYVGFMEAFRAALAAFDDRLPHLRKIDAQSRRATEPVPDLEILDKVLYELGREKQGK